MPKRWVVPIILTSVLASIVITILLNKSPSFEELVAQNLTFGEWVEAYDDAKYGSDERKLIIQKMAEGATEFAQWDIVREKAGYDSDFDDLAVQNMALTAQTAKQWHRLMTVTYDHELRQTAVAKIQELCASFEDWQAVYKISSWSSGSSEYMAEMSITKMLETAQTFEQAQFTFSRLSNRSEQYQAAVTTMAKLAGNYQQWNIVYEAAHWQDRDTRNQALAAMRNRADNFEQWKIIYRHSERDSPKRVEAVERMADYAGVFLEWADVYTAIPDEHELKQIAFVLMDQSPLPFDMWYDVWTTHGSKKVKSLAFSKLSKQAHTFDQWHKIWQNSPSGSDTESMALAKMQEFSTASP